MKHEPKTALTFEEKITAAYMHFCKGLHQHTIAEIYGINQGRVNEACVAIEKVLTQDATPGSRAAAPQSP